MSAAWIIFNSAIRQLIEPGPQRYRLANACTPAFLALKQKEIPQECREEFDALLQLLNVNNNLSRQDVLQAVAALTDKEISAASEVILCIYDKLTRYQPLEVHLIRCTSSGGRRERKPMQLGQVF